MMVSDQFPGPLLFDSINLSQGNCHLKPKCSSNFIYSIAFLYFGEQFVHDRTWLRKSFLERMKRDHLFDEHFNRCVGDQSGQDVCTWRRFSMSLLPLSPSFL